MIHIGHCHTVSDTVIWMPGERVLFMGDAFDYRTHPVVRIGNIQNWIRALGRFEKFPARQIVPGHGPLPPPGKKVPRRIQGIFFKAPRPLGGGPPAGGNPRPGRPARPDG